jgi:hypothetical protein
MARSTDVLGTMASQMQQLLEKSGEISKQLLALVENYDYMLQNQASITENHDIVTQNQKTIIKNQGIITHNQSSIIHNQSLIVKNQAYLKTFIYTQSQLLSLVSQRPIADIEKEVNNYFENIQQEISKGIEQPIGE